MTVDTTKVTRFLDWVRDEEVLMDLAELRYCGPCVGFGVFAKSNIRWNEVATRVPKKLMITAGLIADMAEYAEILKVHRLDPFEVLVLFFCLERLRGAESSWSAYLDVLPATFSTAIATCPDLPLEQLPLSFRQQFITQREEFDVILAKITSVKPNVPRESVDWAWHVVNTRCIFVDNAPHPLVDSSKSGDNLAVIPVMDMLNHSPEAQCLAYFDKHSQKYCVAAQNRSVQEGDQLFVCYGPHDNIRLWVEYGFRLEDNIFNRVNISTDLFVALAKKVNIAVDSEHEDVLKEAALPCTIYASDEDYCFGLRKNCAVLRCPREELRIWKKLVYSEDGENDDEVYADVRRILEELLVHTRAKAAKTEDKLKWMWTDQADILERLLELNS